MLSHAQHIPHSRANVPGLVCHQQVPQLELQGQHVAGQHGRRRLQRPVRLRAAHEGEGEGALQAEPAHGLCNHAVGEVEQVNSASIHLVRRGLERRREE
jgi:hypothetical protein